MASRSALLVLTTVAFVVVLTACAAPPAAIPTVTVQPEATRPAFVTPSFVTPISGAMGPSISHPLEGRSACFQCHQVDGPQPLGMPVTHVDYTLSACASCHTPK